VIALFVTLACAGAPAVDPPSDDPASVRLDLLTDEHAETVAQATAWLLAHPDVARTELEHALQHRPPEAAWVRVLGQLAAPSSVPALRRALKEGDGPTTWEAAHALASLDHDDARRALTSAGQSGSTFARKAVAAALANPDGAWACDTIRAGLRDPEPDVRVGFANAALRASCVTPDDLRTMADRPENASIADRLRSLIHR